MAHRKCTNEVVREFENVHGNRYDYSNVVYINSNTHIKIICQHHGVFEQQPRAHKAGQQCPKCSQSTKWTYGLKTTEQFILEAQKIHRTYDYSLSEYKGSRTKLKILCPLHGVFEQNALSHLQGQGCPHCAGNILKDTNRFISQATSVHGGVYQYHNTTYKTANHKITITCSVHGDFKQKPTQHLRGKGCPKCAIDKSKRPHKTTKQFVKEATTTHNNKYDYSKSKYYRATCKLTIICPQHGEFKQRPRDHINNMNGCPYCATSLTSSSGQLEIANFLKCFTMISECNRNIITPFELDIFMPLLNMAIEYHGHYWHSYNSPETTIEKFRHHLKYDLCAAKNIHLIQIFDFEWIENKHIIKSILLNKLQKSNKIYARKCKIIELTPKQSDEFFEYNHLQGARRAKHSYGLTINGLIVCVMSFSKHNENTWEIIRFANSIGQTVVGGASRLFKQFLKIHSPQSIVSFADRRFSTGQLYKKLGFKLLYATKPNYQYIKKGRKPTRLSRQRCQKHKLPKLLGDNFDQNLTEAQNMFNNGYRRLWDAGHHKFIMNLS